MRRREPVVAEGRWPCARTGEQAPGQLTSGVDWRGRRSVRRRVQGHRCRGDAHRLGVDAPIVGTDAVWKTLRTAACLYDDIQFTDFYDASDRLSLEWEGPARCDEIASISVLRTRNDGAIVEARIHHPPLPALLASVGKLDPRLAAA